MPAVSFQSGLKMEFRRLGSELQVQQNFLQMVFDPKMPTKGRTTAYDYVSPATEVDYTVGVDGTSTDEVNRNSTPAVYLQQRRRVTQQVQKQLHLVAPEYIAQTNQMDVSALVDAYISQAKFAKARSQTRLILELLGANYRENPLIDTADATNRPNTTVSFPLSKVVLPRVREISSGSGTYHAPLDLEAFLQIEADIADDVGSIPEQKAGKFMDSVNGEIKHLLILSSQAKKDLIASNIDRLANSDFYGRDVQFRGLNKIERIASTTLMTIPSTFLPKITGQGSGGSFSTSSGNRHFGARASATGDLNSALSRASASGDVQDVGLHKAWHVIPKYLRLYKPVQYDEDMFQYRDFVKNFQRKIWFRWACQGIREHDIFREVNFSPRNTSLNIV